MSLFEFVRPKLEIYEFLSSRRNFRLEERSYGQLWWQEQSLVTHLPTSVAHILILEEFPISFAFVQQINTANFMK